MTGKTAIITGGSRGIGEATAILFAQHGCNVVINYVENKEAAKRVQEKVQSFGVKGVIVQANMAVKKEVESMVEITMDQFGRIDSLVNNAGIWEYNAIDTMTDENLRRTVDINLMGCFYTSQAVVPHMKKQKSGTIIYISSTAGQRGEAFHSPYAATKGALISLTKSLAAELVEDNIRVNCVAPGWVVTDMSVPSLEEDKEGKITEKILMKRAADPKELAAPILFMASDMSTFITGEILNVNGGAVLCG